MDYLAAIFLGFVLGLVTMVIFLTQIPLENKITKVETSGSKCSYSFGHHFILEECGKFQVGDILSLVKETK